jgi:5-methylcytosine-specific restriction enzyme A
MTSNSEFHYLYNSARWRKRAAHQLKLVPLCEYCAKHGQVEPATVADHITPHRGNLNAFWLGQLQSLCVACHNRPKRAEDMRGYTDEVGLDGWPIDPRHPVNKPRKPRGMSHSR